MPTDTFPITSDTNDGLAGRQSAVWANITSGSFDPADSDQASVIYSLFAGDYYVYNSYLRWDTSTIDDAATITSANLLLYLIARGDVDGASFAADFYDFGGTPSVAADWEQTSSGDAISGVTYASLTLSAVNTIALTGLSGISKTGFTGIRLAPSSSSAPTGNNFVDFAAFAHANQEPRLEVTYTLPASGFPIAWIRA